MMTAEQLKASILQMAMQGKLVEQRPEEGTGEELYQEIQVEKKRLIKEKKIKKQKPLPEITEDEIPFDIPESWKWIILNSAINLLSGADLTPDKYNDVGKGSVYITGASNFVNGRILVNRWTEYPRNIAHNGDLLLTCKGTVGKTVVLELDEAHIARQIMAITPLLCDVRYIDYYIQFIVNDLKKKAKSMIPGIERASVLSAAFPLPPLAEQKRIVSKIEELMSFVDQYADASTKLNTLNTSFPDQMKKSILQEAIQGKLVPQDPNDEPASELLKKIAEEKKRLIKEKKIKKQKPLPEITEDEIPFDIPESWEWVRLSTCGFTQTGNTPSKAHPEYFGNHIPFIGPGDIQKNTIQYDNKGLSESGIKYGRVVGAGSILQVCIGGSIGKCAIAIEKVTFNQQINTITPIMLSSQYLFYVLCSEYFKRYMKEHAGGTATPIINRGIWDTIAVPIPPLAEQKRIVAKLEGVLPLCEKIKL